MHKTAAKSRSLISTCFVRPRSTLTAIGSAWRLRGAAVAGYNDLTQDRVALRCTS